MPKRVQFYGCSEVEADKIAAAAEWMVSERFSESAPTGFHLEKVRKFEICGSYLYQRNFTKIVKRPDGSEIEFPQFSIEEIQFKFNGQEGQLTLFDPSRLIIRNFLSSLSRSFSHRLKVIPLGVDILSWTKAISRLNTILIKKMEFKNVTVAEGVTAEINLQGTGDLFKQFQDLTSNDDTTPRSLRFFFDDETYYSGMIELTSKATAKATREIDSGLLTCLEKAFWDTVEI